MKIALVCDLIDEEQKTGIGNYQTDFIRRITQGFSKDFDFVFVHQKPNPLTRRFDTILTPSWMFRLNPKLEFIISRLYRYLIIPLILSFKGVDVVHNMNYASFVFPDWTWGHRKIVTLYDFIPLMDDAYAPFMERLMAKIGLRISLLKADSIVSISHYSKDLAPSFGVDSKKIYVSHLGLIRPLSGSESRKPAIVQHSEDADFILGVASIAPHKNLETLVDAFFHAKSKNTLLSGLKLVLVGKSRVPSKALAEKTKNTNEVIFTGFASNAELDWLYAHAKAFVFPSRVEGFGLPVLEAMANSCPVISSNSSSLPEVIGNAGILVDPDSVIDFSEAIIKIVTDAGKAKELRCAGILRMSDLDMGKHVEDNVRLYANSIK